MGEFPTYRLQHHPVSNYLGMHLRLFLLLLGSASLTEARRLITGESNPGAVLLQTKSTQSLFTGTPSSHFFEEDAAEPPSPSEQVFDTAPHDVGSGSVPMPVPEETALMAFEMPPAPPITDNGHSLEGPVLETLGSATRGSEEPAPFSVEPPLSNLAAQAVDFSQWRTLELQRLQAHLSSKSKHTKAEFDFDRKAEFDFDAERKRRAKAAKEAAGRPKKDEEEKDAENNEESSEKEARDEKAETKEKDRGHGREDRDHGQGREDRDRDQAERKATADEAEASEAEAEEEKAEAEQEVEDEAERRGPQKPADKDEVIVEGPHSAEEDEGIEPGTVEKAEAEEAPADNNEEYTETQTVPTQTDSDNMEPAEEYTEVPTQVTRRGAGGDTEQSYAPPHDAGRWREAAPAPCPVSDLGPQHGGSCTPQCTWSCDTPKCDELCEPICQAPKCETRCPGMSTKGCSMECTKPHCAVVCSKSICAKGGCPSCTTKCGQPQCKLQCPKSQSCKNVCEQPQCEWKCKAPLDCPKPKCKMVCETPKKCLTSSFAQKLPSLSAGQIAVQSFTAPVPAASNHKARTAPRSSLVDVQVRHRPRMHSPLWKAPQPQQRLVSMPVL